MSHRGVGKRYGVLKAKYFEKKKNEERAGGISPELTELDSLLIEKNEKESLPARRDKGLCKGLQMLLFNPKLCQTFIVFHTIKVKLALRRVWKWQVARLVFLVKN